MVIEALEQFQAVEAVYPAFDGPSNDVAALHLKRLAECDAVVLCWRSPRRSGSAPKPTCYGTGTNSIAADSLPIAVSSPDHRRTTARNSWCSGRHAKKSISSSTLRTRTGHGQRRSGHWWPASQVVHDGRCWSGAYGRQALSRASAFRFSRSRFFLRSRSRSLFALSPGGPQPLHRRRGEFRQRKSSLVRAGLLPLLKEENESPGGRRWIWKELRPGNAPIARLAGALASLSNDDDPVILAARQERIAFELRHRAPESQARWERSEALARPRLCWWWTNSRSCFAIRRVNQAGSATCEKPRDTRTTPINSSNSCSKPAESRRTTCMCCLR